MHAGEGVDRRRCGGDVAIAKPRLEFVALKCERELKQFYHFNFTRKGGWLKASLPAYPIHPIASRRNSNHITATVTIPKPATGHRH
jgi:hypothetical protein